MLVPDDIGVPATQLALYLPESYSDYRYPVTNWSRIPLGGERFVVRGLLSSPPEFGYTQSRKPRLKFVLADDEGSEITGSFFGVSSERDNFLLKVHQKRLPVHVSCSGITRLGNHTYLERPHLVPSKFIGRIIPSYKGKRGKATPEDIRCLIDAQLDSALSSSAEYLLRTAFSSYSLEPGSRPSEKELLTLQKIASDQHAPSISWYDVTAWVSTILKLAHRPPTLESTDFSIRVIEQLAAIAMLVQANRSVGFGGDAGFVCTSGLDQLITSLPHPLSKSQKESLNDIWHDLSSGQVMRRVLSGDVGSGKTITYGLAAVGTAKCGGRCAILMPSEALGSQVYSELLEVFPDLAGKITLALASDSPKNHTSPCSGHIYIGTTTLLYRYPPASFDFVVVDEQHKFSVSQRNSLVEQGTHLLEVSATPIPRTQALLTYARLPISKLEPHTPRTVLTRVYKQTEKQSLFDNIKASIARGEKILVVYPLKEKGKQGDRDLQNVETALPKWTSLLPGAKVDRVHAGMRSSEVTEAIGRFRQGDTDVLLSTLIVETGLNIKNLMRVVVVDCERHGLSALHQIRGRCARYGGQGYFDLVPSAGAPKKSINRVKLLEKYHRGDQIAEQELILRGAGDMASGLVQSGIASGVLYGTAGHLKKLEFAAELLNGECHLAGQPAQHDE